MEDLENRNIELNLDSFENKTNVEITNDKSKKNGSKCKKCNKTFKFKKELLKHKQETHPITTKCRECERLFTCSIDLEIHVKESHKDIEGFKCNLCEKIFVVEWRLNKHQDMHKVENARNCHFFNNNKHCPFEELGCMFQHLNSPQCYFKKSCRNTLCQFRHDPENNCSECDYIGKTHSDLKNHEHIMHTDTSDNMSENEEEIDNDDEQNQSKDGSEYFPCDSCDDVFTDIEDLIEHYGDTGHIQ